MFIVQTGAAALPAATVGNHWSKPLRTMRAWNSSVNGAASCRSLWRSGESSQACKLASVSKRRMASQLSCTPGTGGSKR
jgi:hypothetical protein